MAVKLSAQGALMYATMLLYAAAFGLLLARVRRAGMTVFAGGFAVAAASCIFRWWRVEHFPLQNLFEVFLCLGALMFPLSLLCRRSQTSPKPASAYSGVGRSLIPRSPKPRFRTHPIAHSEHIRSPVPCWFDQPRGERHRWINRERGRPSPCPTALPPGWLDARPPREMSINSLKCRLIPGRNVDKFGQYGRELYKKYPGPISEMSINWTSLYPHEVLPSQKLGSSTRNRLIYKNTPFRKNSISLDQFSGKELRGWGWIRLLDVQKMT